MKKIILSKLKKIASVAQATGFKGKLSIAFVGVSITEFDAAIDAITEYPRHGYHVEVAPSVQVSLYLD